MSSSASLSRLDLNLLIALDALLSERSVTRAAQRLHLSQPALSASLARLRTHFGDPLLSRQGNSYELTPLAERLADHTTTALEAARRVFESQADWTPETSTREFVLFGSDYAFSTVGRTVAQIATTIAPGVRFRFQLHTPGVVDDAVNRLRSADGILIPHGHVTGLQFADLWSDGWVLLADENNPAIGPDGLPFEALAELPWVFTYHSRSAFTAAGQQVHQLGIEPRIETVVESFLALPHFIVGTNRLGLVQGALALEMSRMPGIRVLEPPFQTSPLKNALWWHPVHQSDPEHAWMRSLFLRAGERLSETARGSRGASA